jgi:hypothetical protein
MAAARQARGGDDPDFAIAYIAFQRQEIRA